jgi:phosphopantetheinyl transferase
LYADDELKIKKIKLQHVRLQKLACRAVLAKILGSNKIKITYSKTGHPQIKEHCISFSHTKNTVAVALANIPVGIDIEELSPRILPLYSRFMSKEEINECDINHLQELYYFWCAKEAMYKWVATKKLDFIEDLRVYKNEDKGIILKNQIVQLATFQFDNKFVVVCY